MIVKAEHVMGLFKDGGIGFLMSLAGAEVKPEGFTHASDGVVQWSVYPKSTGSLLGYISPAREPYGTINIRIRNDDDTSFKIEVVYDPFTTERLLSWFGTFGGALLTLPGIIAFVREWLRRRTQESEHAKAAAQSDDVDQSIRFDADQIGAKRRKALSV